jgi:hypothetical protein
MQSGSSVADSDPGVRSRYELQLVAASLYKELNWSQKVLQIFIPVKIIWSQYGNSGYPHSTPIHEPMAYHFM